MRRLCLALLLLLPAFAAADERILRFHSDVVIQADGWIEVTENITVRAEGQRIRRGIYRDLPNEYRDKNNNTHIVSIEPLVVTRNGAREDFHKVNIDRGIRVYFGHSDRYINSGEHTYQFRYRAHRMLGFFEEHDELYWNVTGFDWAFPIDEATATVSFQFDVPPARLSFEAYTGPFGGRGRDYTANITADGAVTFKANEALSAVNGLTIVVGWPKGFVEEPTALTRFGWLVRDNISVIIAFSGLLLLWGYYLPVWRNHGKDPEEGVIVPRYHPPDGFSPASLRYIRQMYYDDKVMTAAVVNLAVKGYLKINAKGGDHSLTKTDPGSDPPPMAPGEQELYDGLFGASAPGKTVELSDDNHVRLGAAKKAHGKSLKSDYKKRYFETNGLLNAPGVVIVIGTLLAALNIGSGKAFWVICVIIAMILTMVFFAVVMRRPTIRGRKLLDQMLGFRDYIEVAEKDELNLRNPPDKTPQLFELYLPYALALGVDQAWSEKFASVLSSVRDPSGKGWQPTWYNGAWDSSRPLATTNSLSSGLNSAIARSVTPPSSSSGGGGGGFSGGGGGGGGGGGW